MGTGDYICVTLRGGAPWGFTLREGEGDTYTPFFVTQVEEGGRAFLAGVREGDEVVSLNGEVCADLTLLRAFALIDTSIDCLQLLVKRYCTVPSEDCDSEDTYCGETGSSGEAVESTTLHIFSPKHRSHSPRELYISESHDEAYYGEFDRDKGFPKGPQLLCTELHSSSSGDRRGPAFTENDGEAQRCFSPGDMVELQVSLSEQTLDDVGCTSLGSAYGIQGELSNREATKTFHSVSTSHYVPCPVREPLGQHGVVLSSPSMLGQVEVILQQPAASGGAGRGILSVGGPRISGSSGSQSEGEEGGGGGNNEGVPGSLTVSFGIPSEEATPGAEEQESDSEGDQDKPNKHKAKHARLRRSESLSEKQVKEAKSKCKRIALLLTAAPPNPNNKGVLMFKKHRQRAKKYTLVSYGTGEDEPEFSDEEDEENEDDKEGTHTVEFTLVAPDGSEIDKHFLSNASPSKGVLTINWDKGLLEIERNLNNQAEMECLPETKGKGALMFAQRRLRMDEISAEHEELRRHGIPVEGVVEAEKKVAEPSYMQSTTEGHAYMDVNTHQQTQQQQQQYQQYQEQQYYEQQQSYQQQQQYQQQYEQQQQQYEQQQYQQQQMYQQQQQYHQEQHQMQQYSTNVNGTVQHQTSEMQSSFSNRTAKPFSSEQMAATLYSPAMSGINQEAAGPGEQIASRDERISTPAIKTGFLMDARKRNTGKPMFTFKEAPKVSPNPALLNLLNSRGKKIGFESGPEEDYLSLGAEACNFLQSPRVKHKTPPPVAPKPMINLNTWSQQIEVTNQEMSQQAENSVSTPAVAPTTETDPAPELEPAPAPAPEPSPPPVPQEAPASKTTEEQHTWSPPEHQSQHQPVQAIAQEENGHINPSPQPEPAPVTSWAVAQTQAQQQPPTSSRSVVQAQPQEPPPSQSPQLPWVTRQPPQIASSQPQAPTNAWNPQSQPSWSQPQEQAPAQTHAHPPWAQHQEQAQPQPQVQQQWAHSQEQPNQHQMQPAWGQHQEPIQQQPQAPWAQPSQTNSQPQPPWMQQPQQKSQAQPPWVQQAQQESQPQPPWAQHPQHQAPQQAWPQAQTPGQPQPPWMSAQPQPQPQSQQTQQQQPSANAWPPTQTQPQVQPPWMQSAQQPPAQPQTNVNPWMPVPAQAQSQPSWAQHPSEQGQHPMNAWAQEQGQVQNQPPWAHPVSPQPAPQPNWQQPTSNTPPQAPVNAWAPGQTQPQTPVNAWAPQSQQAPVTAPTSMVNTRPSPKPWQPPQSAQQSRTPPSPPQRMHSLTIGQRSSSPVNPMATVLNPASAGSAFEMPVVKGKGADMFAKRLSRMEKFVVDSETVEANKASRPTSPTASLPNEWKYTPNALGRSYSLSPSARVPFAGQKSASASSSPKPPSRASSATPPARQTSWLAKGLKPLSPWEAASRHPLGLVDEAFAFQNLQQSLASTVHLAAQRKILPEPPAEWKARVSSHQAPQKTWSHTWSQSLTRGHSRAPLPSFVPPTRGSISAPAGNAGYRSLPRQWQPQRSVTEASPGAWGSHAEFKRPLGKQTYKSVYTSNTWSWKR